MKVRSRLIIKRRPKQPGKKAPMASRKRRATGPAAAVPRTVPNEILQRLPPDLWASILEYHDEDLVAAAAANSGPGGRGRRWRPAARKPITRHVRECGRELDTCISAIAGDAKTLKLMNPFCISRCSTWCSTSLRRHVARVLRQYVRCVVSTAMVGPGVPNYDVSFDLEKITNQCCTLGGTRYGMAHVP